MLRGGVKDHNPRRHSRIKDFFCYFVDVLLQTSKIDVHRWPAPHVKIEYKFRRLTNSTLRFSQLMNFSLSLILLLKFSHYNA